MLRLKLDKDGKVKGWELMPGSYWISVQRDAAYITPMAPSEVEGPGPGGSFSLKTPLTLTKVDRRLLTLEFRPSEGGTPRKPARKARTRKEDPHPPLKGALHAGRKAG